MVLDPELSSRYWLVRKVCALVGYYGGLRNIELRSIEFGQTFEGGEKSFEVDHSGYWFKFERGKQRGLPETSVFCVPRRQPDWSPVASSSARSPVDFDPASVVDRYLHLLEADLKVNREQLSGSFFKSTHGKNGKFFRNVPMGKNILAKVGWEFAEELVLQNPQCFTGHCWRRSCGTNASDAGVNVTTLMAQLGWSTPKTAIGYVRKSRITSYQMSMFLSNCQRQNTDIDLCLAKIGSPVVVGGEAAVVRPKNLSIVKDSKPPRLIPVVDSTLTDKFAGHLNSAKRTAFVPISSEGKIIAASRSAVLDLISGSGQPIRTESRSGTSRVQTFGQESESVHYGGGGGDGANSYIDREVGDSWGRGCGEREGGVDIGGGSVVQDREANAVVDSRVSSILSNIRHQGELHVHFHFGK